LELFLNNSPKVFYGENLVMENPMYSKRAAAALPKQTYTFVFMHGTNSFGVKILVGNKLFPHAQISHYFIRIRIVAIRHDRDAQTL
jgi:hypothetical protein